jgi:GT2 family glycosyltransferase
MRCSSYPHAERIIVDNGSTCTYTRDYLSYLASQKDTLVLHDFSHFNFSHLCNLGAEHATGDMLLFLNNDMEVLQADWLEQLLIVAGQPAVGVTGATLLYPDGTLQHAGIFPGAAGQWLHAYRGLAATYPGDRQELHCVRAVPAVTGACLMIRRDLFRQLGGFDERYPVTANDVDLCCRVRRQGLLVAITPHARLLHYESLSRGYSLDVASKLVNSPT